MMRFFRRRSAIVDFIDGIRPELKGLPAPAPTEALRARILASREAGARTILPDGPEERRLPAYYAIGLALAAALAILLVPIELRRSAIGADLGSPGVFGHSALTETVPSALPALAPLRFTLPERLRPLSLEFERRLTDSTGQRASLNRIAIHVAPSAIAGVPAWRVVSEDREAWPASRVDVETVFVARSDVRLLRRNIHVSPYRRFERINVWQDFLGRADSVVGRMNTEGPSIGAGRTFARRLPPALAPYLTDRIASVLLMAAPLDRGFAASASLVGWGVRDDDVLIPIEVRVEGEETVTVPAGRFDCWRLSVRFSGGQVDYWARKSDGLGVRSLNAPGAPTQGTREIVLTRISE